MRTKQPLAVAAVLLLLAVFLCACGGDAGGTGQNEDVSKITTPAASDSGMVTAHFPAFEVSVPSGWTVRGNVGKLYEGADAFLLVGPVTEGSAEECIAAELELFFNTEYYRSQVAFQYDRYEETPGGIKVGGSLTNGRTGDRVHFAGGFFKEPDAYVLYLWDDGRASAEAVSLAEASYESFRVL